MEFGCSHCACCIGCFDCSHLPRRKYAHRRASDVSTSQCPSIAYRIQIINTNSNLIHYEFGVSTHTHTQLTLVRPNSKQSNLLLTKATSGTGHLVPSAATVHTRRNLQLATSFPRTSFDVIPIPSASPKPQRIVLASCISILECSFTLLSVSNLVSPFSFTSAAHTAHFSPRIY